MRHGSAGTYLLTHDARPKIDPGDGYYYFLVGTLGTEFDGTRSWEAVYGYTEILPGRMTIGLIKSPDGNTYFDLSGGVIAGNIQIKAGSSGYNNLSDRPDLGIYATYSDFRVLDDRISGVVTAVDERMEEIMSSGFITEADATKIFAKTKDVENWISVAIDGIELNGNTVIRKGNRSVHIFDPDNNDNVLNVNGQFIVNAQGYVSVDNIFARAIDCKLVQCGDFVMNKDDIIYSGSNIKFNMGQFGMEMVGQQWPNPYFRVQIKTGLPGDDPSFRRMCVGINPIPTMNNLPGSKGDVFYVKWDSNNRIFYIEPK